MARTLLRGNTQIMPESITNDEVAFKGVGNVDGILLEKIQHSDEIVRTNAPVASDVDMGGNKIVGVAAGQNPSDVVIKSQLDSISAGLDPKESVRVATIGNITLSNLQTIDGVSLQVGDRVLVKNQTDPVENGIYEAVDSGDWVRASDADGDISGEISGGMFTFVESGSTNAGTGWVVVADGTLNPGTDPISFTQFAGGGSITGGFGVYVTGTEVNADVDNSTIINTGGPGDQLSVKNGGITQTQLDTDSVVTSKVLDGNITGIKLNSDVAGSGLSKNGSTNAIDVNVDGSTIIINGDTLEADPSAISNELAGDGLVRDAGSGELDVNVDGTSLKITGNTISVDASVITSSIAGDGLVRDGSSGELDVNVDSSTIEVVSDVVKVKAGGITETEINSSAIGNGLNGGSGTQISVDSSVVLTAANYVVRESHNATSTGQTQVTLADSQVLGTEMVFVNGILMEEGASNDYTISSAGEITFTFGLQYHPTNNSKRDKVSVTYFKA